MQNMRRRLHMLERLPQFQLPLSPLEQIRSLALQSLSQQDLELLRTLALEQSAEMRPRELSEREAAACGAWGNALEAEARRMGFRSFAKAERTAGQRR
jgi:hypothetical protein